MAQRDPNYFYMLFGLLATLALAPVLRQAFPELASLLTNGAFTLTLLLGTGTLFTSQREFRAGLGLAALSVAVTAYDAYRPSALGSVVGTLTWLAFCGMSAAFILARIARGRGIDGNRLTGAVCVYLLLGVSIGLLNMLVFSFTPEAFRGLSGGDTEWHGLDLLYYSFVTMTTLGYGDITPVTPVAKALAYLAAVAGQLYVAILIGALVGLYLRREAD